MQHSYVQGLSLNSLIFSKEIVATSVGTDELVCNTTKINFVRSLAVDVEQNRLFRQCCVMVLRRNVLIRRSDEEDLSAVALQTGGKVRYSFSSLSTSLSIVRTTTDCEMASAMVQT